MEEKLPVRKSIAWAMELYRERGLQLLSDEMLSEFFNAYKKACKKSSSLRVEAGVVDECRRCEEEEGGSCCGAGIEKRYDRWLLLVNILLGAGLPKKRLWESSCLFLGPSGCTLPARDVLCVNYMCQRINRRCDRVKLLSLQEAEGEELRLLFLIHEHLKKIVNQPDWGEEAYPVGDK
ncbi:MAG: hypothetical protein C4582_00610 [Desulfobacteraceae bacterium]|jgi:hypothetical protein|nr:MAG: hypothetical protein C4582_00610 [Desulfobacteraceae bacterium]